ncbi:MAG: hypothetical protein ACK518_01425 [bacterium]
MTLNNRSIPIIPIINRSPENSSFKFLDNALIILGSGFIREHEYNLPLQLDPNSNWIVFSIDTKENYNRDELKIDNIEVVRLQISLANYDEIINVLKSYHVELCEKIYIIDSVSCGFITNASVHIINYLLDENKRVYWTHYISPYNESPSTLHKAYSNETFYNILNEVLDEQHKKLLKNDKAFISLRNVFNNTKNVIEFVSTYKHLFNKNAPTLVILKYFQEQLTLNDIQNFEDEFIVVEKTEQINHEKNISCIASNTYGI